MHGKWGKKTGFDCSTIKSFNHSYKGYWYQELQKQFLFAELLGHPVDAGWMGYFNGITTSFCLLYILVFLGAK